jgi:hypothetical protein
MPFEDPLLEDLDIKPSSGVIETTGQGIAEHLDPTPCLEEAEEFVADEKPCLSIVEARLLLILRIRQTDPHPSESYE